MQKHGVYPGSGHGAVHPAVCACTVLPWTGVLVEGGYKQGGRGSEASKSQKAKLIEAKCQYMGERAGVVA